MSDASLWAMLIACWAMAYASRGGAVLASSWIASSAFFQWASCVSYAMVASLIARLVAMPGGILEQTTLTDRLIALVIGLTLYFGSQQRLLLGVLTGASALAVLHHLRQHGIG
jgi:branched-subunit amino acid transport protein